MVRNNILPCSVRDCVPKVWKHLKRFRFPRAIEWAEKWKQLCQNPKLDHIPTKRLHDHHAVCGKHFARHQFTNELMDRLNRNTVPTLFLPVADSIDTNHCIPQDVSKDVCAPLHNIVEVNVTIPPIDSENTKDSVITSVSANYSGDSNSENCDFSEIAHPVSSDELPSALGVSRNQESEISLLASATTERTLTAFDQYYRYTLCRLCFSYSDSLANIFEDRQECGFQISGAIEDLLQFKVSKTDNLPQFICPSCCMKLGQFKEYKDALVKAKEEFEKSLYKLRKSSWTDENSMDIISDRHESPMVEDLEECKEDGMEHLSEEKETDVEDLVAEYRECLSDSEDAITDFEDTAGDGQTETRRSIDPNILEIVLQEEFKCYDCGEVFQYRNLLTKHRKEHRKTWPLPCSYCDMRFKSLMDLNNHIIMHSNYKPYECEHCGLRCRLKSTLCRHKMTHSGDRPFLCSTCGLGFRERIQLRDHLRMHSGVKCYKCEECGAEFGTSHKLIHHYTRHSKERHNVCGECGKSFKKRNSLIWHVTCVHQSEKRFQCEICLKRFSISKYLYDHMKIHRKQAMAK